MAYAVILATSSQQTPGCSGAATATQKAGSRRVETPGQPRPKVLKITFSTRDKKAGHNSMCLSVLSAAAEV
jgi:hypothetical protein